MRARCGGDVNRMTSAARHTPWKALPAIELYDSQPYLIKLNSTPGSLMTACVVRTRPALLQSVELHDAW